MTTDQPEHTPPLREIMFAGTPVAYTREWYCTPPDDHQRYQIVRSQWDGNYHVQRIYEIRLDDTQ